MARVSQTILRGAPRQSRRSRAPERPRRDGQSHAALRRAGYRAQQRRSARGLSRSPLTGVDVRDRKLAQVVIIACRRPGADVIIRADVGAKAERPPDGTHVRSPHQLGALLVAKVSFECDGALEGVAAAIPAMVVRYGYLDVGKRDFPPSR